MQKDLGPVVADVFACIHDVTSAMDHESYTDDPSISVRNRLYSQSQVKNN